MMHGPIHMTFAYRNVVFLLLLQCKGYAIMGLSVGRITQITVLLVYVFVPKCMRPSIQGEHKVFPRLQTFITRKLCGIQTILFF